MSGVKLREVRVHLSRAQIVDRYNPHFLLKIRPLVQSSQYVATNPTVSVDCYVDHFVSSPVSEVCDGGHRSDPVRPALAEGNIVVLLRKSPRKYDKTDFICVLLHNDAINSGEVMMNWRRSHRD
jgi:hypothetical protein